MTVHTKSSPFGTMIFVAVLTLVSSACAGGWQTEQLTPAQVVEKHPERIVVHLSDKSRLELAHPTIVGDSLLGVQPGGVQRAVPLAAVTRVDTPGYNGWPILVGGMVGFGIVMLIANGGKAY